MVEIARVCPSAVGAEIAIRDELSPAMDAERRLLIPIRGRFVCVWLTYSIYRYRCRGGNDRHIGNDRRNSFVFYKSNVTAIVTVNVTNGNDRICGNDR